jgi:hypothetical protein
MDSRMASTDTEAVNNLEALLTPFAWQQGGQIGRIFAQWAIVVYFELFL